MSSFKPSCASRTFLAKNLRSFLLWVVDGRDFCRSSSGVVMRPSQKHVTQLATLVFFASGAVPTQTKSKSEASLLISSLPKAREHKTRVTADFWQQDVCSRKHKWQSQFLTWRIPASLCCGQNRVDETPTTDQLSYHQMFLCWTG